MESPVDRQLGVSEPGAPARELALPFRLSPRGLGMVLAALVGASVACMVGTWLARNLHLVPSWVPYEVRFLIVEANLAAENVIAAWLASLLFLLPAPAALTVCGIELLESRSRRDRAFALGWVAIATVSVLLSLSELGSLHEPSHRVVESPFGYTLHGWVGVLAIPIVVVGGLLLWFAWRWLRNHGAAFSLMAAGVLLYLSVPLQEQLETSMRLADGQAAGYQRPIGLLLLEEGAELFGSILLLAAVLIYLLRRLQSLGAGSEFVPCAGCVPRLRFTGPGEHPGGMSRTLVEGTLVLPARTAILGVVALVLLLGIGLVVADLGLEILLDVGRPEERGDPLNWFPATLAAVTAAACLYVRYAAGRLNLASDLRSPLLIVALFSLLVGVEFGSDLSFTADLWEGNPRRQASVKGAFVVAAFGSAVFVWQRGRGPLRAAAAIWSLALGAAFVLPPGRLGVVLGFLACGVFLLGLVFHWVWELPAPEAVPVEEERPTGAAGRR